MEYLVLRGEAPGAYSTIARIGPGITTYEASGLTPGVLYYFVVQAVDLNGILSGLSNELAIVLPVTPESEGSQPKEPEPPLWQPVSPPADLEVMVTSEAALQEAIATLQSGSTIVLAPGIYRLGRPLDLQGPLAAVTLRGATGRAADVVLMGPAPSEATGWQPVPAIRALGVIDALTIADLSIADASGPAVMLDGDVITPHLRNLHISGRGGYLVAQVNGSGHGVSGGVIEFSIFETAGCGPDRPPGLDLRGALGWTIRANTFVGSGAFGPACGPVVLLWQGSGDTLVDGNRFVDGALEIVVALSEGTLDQHAGGVIRNNAIVRATGRPFSGAGISVLGSPDTELLHNTILVGHTSAVAIVYQHTDSRGLLVVNNLTDAAIVGEDHAEAMLEGNVTTATAWLFVNATAGDLRLRSDATVAIDGGAHIPSAEHDHDGQLRPYGVAPDVGAYEWRPPSPP
ncbi:MAG: hypothetical protein H0V80_04770 [Acidobacteria bacterium]|nr:hypothetical protein [Acidobacteriota bacterium]